MEKETSLVALSEQVSRVEETGKIDPSIFETFDSAIVSCKRDEEFWVSNEEVSTKASFVLYHASRNSRIILEKMKKGFEEALGEKENPTVAVHSLRILPDLNGICDLITSLKKDTISSNMVTFIMNRVRGLRNIAREVNMLPSPEEEIQKVDKKMLKKHFGHFMDSLQEII